jgi:hypothetical protein
MIGERTLWNASRCANVANARCVITAPKQNGQPSPQNLVA